MKAIVAVTNDFGIGKDGDLLFNIPEDKRFFRAQTTGGTVIMGRKTFLSLPGGALKNRENIVLTRNPDFKAEGAVVCHSADELLSLIGNHASDKTIVIGGGEIYSLLLDRCDTILVTKIDAVRESDTFFPNVDASPLWTLSEESEEKSFEGVSYRFCTYVKS